MAAFFAFLAGFLAAFFTFLAGFLAAFFAFLAGFLAAFLAFLAGFFAFLAGFLAAFFFAAFFFAAMRCLLGLGDLAIALSRSAIELSALDERGHDSQWMRESIDLLFIVLIFFPDARGFTKKLCARRMR